MNPYTGSQTKTHTQEQSGDDSSGRGDQASPPDGSRGLSDSFVSMLARNWQILTGALLLGLAVAGIYSYYQNPTYRAETTLLVRDSAPTGGIGSNEPAGADAAVGDGFVPQEIQRARSNQVRRLVADAVGDSIPPWAKASAFPILGLPGSQSPSSIADKLLENVDIEPVESSSRIFRISATSSQSDEAVLLSKVYARVYAKHRAEQLQASFDDRLSYLDRIEERKREELSNLRTEMERMKKRLGLANPGSHAGALSGHIWDLKHRLQQIKHDLAAARESADRWSRRWSFVRNRVPLGSDSADRIGLSRLIAQRTHWIQQYGDVAGGGAPDSSNQAGTEYGAKVTPLLVQREDRPARTRIPPVGAALRDSTSGAEGARNDSTGPTPPHLRSLTWMTRMATRAEQDSLKIEDLRARKAELTRQIQRNERRLERLIGNTAEFDRLQQRIQHHARLSTFLAERETMVKEARDLHPSPVQILKEASSARRTGGLSASFNFFLAIVLGLVGGGAIAATRRRTKTSPRGRSSNDSDTRHEDRPDGRDPDGSGDGDPPSGQEAYDLPVVEWIPGERSSTGDSPSDARRGNVPDTIRAEEAPVLVADLGEEASTVPVTCALAEKIGRREIPTLVIHERGTGMGLDTPGFANRPTLEQHVLDDHPLRPELLETPTDNVYYLPRTLPNEGRALAPACSDLDEFLTELAAFFPQVIVSAPGIFTPEFRADPLVKRATRGILITDENDRSSDTLHEARRRLAQFQITLLATILRTSDAQGDVLRLSSPRERTDPRYTG